MLEDWKGNDAHTCERAPFFKRIALYKLRNRKFALELCGHGYFTLCDDVDHLFLLSFCQIFLAWERGGVVMNQVLKIVASSLYGVLQYFP